MKKATKGALLVAALSVTLMLLSPWQRYCLKCWAFYPIYKMVIGGFHNNEQFIDGYYYYMPSINPPHEIVNGRAYKTTKDDFVLSTYPKSGTHAGMLMLVHLMSKGQLCQEGCAPHKLTFGFEFPQDIILTLNSSRELYPTTPRIIGTHMPAPHLKPNGASGKFLVIIRDPVKQMLSRRTMEFFLFGHILRLPLKDFVTLYTEQRKTGWADHAYQWWRLRDLPNVKIIFYEDIVKTPEETVKAVAKFAGIKMTKDLLEIVTTRMSKEWAIKHEDGVHSEAVTPFSPPAAIREESGSASSFIVDSSKFHAMTSSERFSEAQEAHIRENAKGKLLAMGAADGGSDAADFIKNCPGYFS